MESEKTLLTVTVIYLLAVNITGALINIADKAKAKHNKWRVPESVLWAIALSGGTFGSYITMKIIRHKTKHKSFMVVFPMLITIQIAIIIYLLVNNIL